MHIVQYTISPQKARNSAATKMNVIWYKGTISRTN